MTKHNKRKKFLKPHTVILSFLLTVMLFTVSVHASDFSNLIVPIKGTGYVVDSFNGVDALYRPGGSDGSNSTYSCAAYVKKYYKAIYGVTPNNLFHNRTPGVTNDSFIIVSSPQPGDIAAMNTSGYSTHWAIVKEVGKSNVTLIEQNWKWSQGGQYVTKINRTVSNNTLRFYRLSSVDKKSDSSVEPSTSDSFTPADNKFQDPQILD